MPKEKEHNPGMSDAENVFEEIESQEKAERKRLWLEEHGLGKNKPKGGEKHDDDEGSKTSKGEPQTHKDSQSSKNSGRRDEKDDSR